MYPTVQAAYNWWGRGEVSYVGGRIWERRDDDNMIGVSYVPVLPDNTTVLQGFSINCHLKRAFTIDLQ